MGEGQSTLLAKPRRSGRLHRALFAGGPPGNEQLTALTGVLLIVLFAALGVTILRVGELISAHLFIGLMLMPAVLLKLASTGYRFTRYYTRERVYRERGAPPIGLRLLAPAVLASTVAVFATGVALLAAGPGAAGLLRELHKLSFIVWIAFMAIHVLGHLPDLQRILLRRRSGQADLNTFAAGRLGRAISLASALVAGTVLAVLLIPHFGAWSHFETFRHR